MDRKEQIKLKAQTEVMRNRMTEVISRHIQSTVDAYNKANGTAFEKVHNCAAYKDIASYPHQPFCQAVLEWNAEVWVTARRIESEVVSGERLAPTPAELVGELPEFIFT